MYALCPFSYLIDPLLLFLNQGMLSWRILIFSHRSGWSGMPGAPDDASLSSLFQTYQSNRLSYLCGVVGIVPTYQGICKVCTKRDRPVGFQAGSVGAGEDGGQCHVEACLHNNEGLLSSMNYAYKSTHRGGPARLTGKLTFACQMISRLEVEGQ